MLDPIDGTKSFISGMPTWGTLIGLMHSGRPVYGMMAQPFTRERYSGDGKRARLRTLAASRGDAPPIGLGDARAAHARLRDRSPRRRSMTTSPALIRDAGRPRGIPPGRRRGARSSRYGGDCYAYCALAAGFVDLVIETDLKPHDIVALVPIIEGAGGVITTWDGEAAAKGGRILAAGDPRLHEEARALLTSA